MDNVKSLGQTEDWDTLVRFLPTNWEEKAKELGALRRCRRFSGAGALLRTLLIHLSDGCSLRETVVRAKQGGIASISDVALLKRLKASGEWLRWMAEQTMVNWVDKQPPVVFGSELNIRVIDGSTIQEPGSTGSTWRIHYSICLPSLRCDEVQVTSPKVGESFKRFTVRPGDLFLGDRGFAHRAGISHVVDAGGGVLVRINLTNLPLVEADGKPFPLLTHLRTLAGAQIGDWEVCVPHDGRLIPGRVCAVRKSNSAAEKARRKALAENRRKGHAVRPETIEAAAYVFVFTTLDRRFSATTVLEVYRGRWQVELAFKRLKSIIGLGHLKKTDLQAAKAWLHGKLLVAFLIEALITAGERFFPWGYPIRPAYPTIPMSLERNIANASPIA
ncbi:MAG: IS4 family transposase [Chloroflexota bacterium]